MYQRTATTVISLRAALLRCPSKAVKALHAPMQSVYDVSLSEQLAEAALIYSYLDPVANFSSMSSFNNRLRYSQGHATLYNFVQPP